LEERAIDQAILLVEGDLGCVLDKRSSSSQVLLFRVSTGKVLKPISSQGVDAVLSLQGRAEDDDRDDNPQLVQDDDDDNDDSDCFWLRRGKTIAYIQIQDHKRYSFRTLTLECTTTSSNSNQQSLEGRVGFLLQRSQPRRLLAMQVGMTSHNDCRIQTVSLPVPLDDNSVTATVPISFPTLESTRSANADATTTTTSKKRGANTAVLGPGQVGGEARGTTDGTTTATSGSNKRTKLDQLEDDDDDDDEDEDDGPTLAERLRQLQEAMDHDDDDNDDDDNNKNKSHIDGNTDDEDEKFVPQHATTESLTQLLQQALQSNDTAMLEMALEVRDPVILMESCRQLELAHLSRLLLALTARLATKPARAELLCRWIKAVLQQCGGAQALEEEGVLEHLQALQNLVQERLEVFPMLLQLEGRLARMVGEQ
jgi:hypothetical protein